MWQWQPPGDSDIIVEEPDECENDETKEQATSTDTHSGEAGMARIDQSPRSDGQDSAPDRDTNANVESVESLPHHHMTSDTGEEGGDNDAGSDDCVDQPCTPRSCSKEHLLGESACRGDCRGDTLLDGAAGSVELHGIESDDAEAGASCSLPAGESMEVGKMPSKDSSRKPSRCSKGSADSTCSKGSAGGGSGSKSRAQGIQGADVATERPPLPLKVAPAVPSKAFGRPRAESGLSKNSRPPSPQAVHVDVGDTAHTPRSQALAAGARPTPPGSERPSPRETVADAAPVQRQVSVGKVSNVSPASPTPSRLQTGHGAPAFLGARARAASDAADVQPTLGTNPVEAVQEALVDRLVHVPLAGLFREEEADWFQDLFGFKETELQSQQVSCEFGKITVNDREFAVGSWSTPSLHELRRQGLRKIREIKDIGAESDEEAKAEVTNFFADQLLGKPGVRIVNEDPAELLSDPSNQNAVFQVASQFNCLHLTEPSETPEAGITSYAKEAERTQGRCCAIACGAGTLYRNYLVEFSDAIGREQVGQTAENQLECLQDFSKLGSGEPPGRYFKVQGGFTLAEDKELVDLNAKLATLGPKERDDLRGQLRVGVQDGVQVTSKSWGQDLLSVQGREDQLVSQVFTGACSVTLSSNTELWEPMARLVLEAVYEATLWRALLKALDHEFEDGSRQVFLTTFEGGSFGNPMPWVADAIDRAIEKVCRENELALQINLVTQAARAEQFFQDVVLKNGQQTFVLKSIVQEQYAKLRANLFGRSVSRGSSVMNLRTKESKDSKLRLLEDFLAQDESSIDAVVKVVIDYCDVLGTARIIRFLQGLDNPQALFDFLQAILPTEEGQKVDERLAMELWEALPPGDQREANLVHLMFANRALTRQMLASLPPKVLRDAVTMQDEKMNTPVHLLFNNPALKDASLVQTIAKAIPKDVLQQTFRVEDAEGRSPVFNLFSNPAFNEALLKALPIEVLVEALVTRDHNGLTPVHELFGNPAMSDSLLRQFLDWLPEEFLQKVLSMKDGNGHTPLYHMISFKEDGHASVTSANTVRSIQVVCGSQHPIKNLLSADDASRMVLASWRTKARRKERDGAAATRKMTLALLASDSFVVRDPTGHCHEIRVDHTNAEEMFKYATLGDGFLAIFAPRVGEALDAMLSKRDCNFMFISIMMFDFALRAVSAMTFSAFTFVAVRRQQSGLEFLSTLLMCLVSLCVMRETFQFVGALRGGHCLQYFGSGWNWLSLTLSATTVMCVYSHNIEFLIPLSEEGFAVLMGFTSFLYWVELMESLRYLHKQFSVLVHALFESAKAMAPFVVIMFIFILAYGTLFWVLLQDTFPEDQPTPFADPGLSVLHVFLMVLGGFKIEWFMEKEEVALPVFLLFMLMMVIVALNVLIAIVSEAYEGAVAQADVLFCVNRFQMLAEIYNTSGWLNFRSRTGPRYLQFCQGFFIVFVFLFTLPFSLVAFVSWYWKEEAIWSIFNIGDLPEILLEGGSGEWSGRVNFLKKELSANTHHVLARLDQFDKEKLQGIINEQKSVAEQQKSMRSRLDKMNKKIEKMAASQDEIKTMIASFLQEARSNNSPTGEGSLPIVGDRRSARRLSMTHL